MLTLRWVDKFGYIFFISAISLLCKNLTEYIRAGLLRSNWIAKVHMAVNDCEISYFVFSSTVNVGLISYSHSSLRSFSFIRIIFETFRIYSLYSKHPDLTKNSKIQS